MSSIDISWQTIPTREQIAELADMTPQYMWPSDSPLVAFSLGALSNQQCDDIITTYKGDERYKFPHCDATTVECFREPLHDVLQPIFDWGWEVNKAEWGFVLAPDAGAWLQTYEVGDSYALHTDASPGQSRKLTVIAMLTDEADYLGGELRLYLGRMHKVLVPRQRGTLVAFPAWVPHEVYSVEQGIRQTINLGYWGPRFK